MREAYEEKAWGFVPDVARLQIILKYGGIYLDTDVELVRSPEELLSDGAFLGRESEKAVNLGQGFGAVPNHPLILAFLKDYENLHFRNEDGSLNRRPSPGIQTDTLLKLGLCRKDVMQKIKGAVIYPTEYFCPVSYETGEKRLTENTFSIHHYDGSWLTKEERFWDALQRKINRRLGKKAGAVVWMPIRFFRQIKKKGAAGAFHLLAKRLEQKIRHEI